MSSRMVNKPFDVLVIGAGINGLSAAYSLSHRKNLKIGILEQFSIGHVFGSSHGASRTTRSTYPHPTYIKLIQRAQNLEWPRWEKELGCQLIHRNPGCFFGTGKKFEEYIQAIRHSGLEIDLLDVSKAKTLFPQFRFQNAIAVLHDRTGGLIAAQKTIEHLKKGLLKNSVQIFEHTKAVQIDSSQDPIVLMTNQGEMSAHRLIIATGPWIKELVPRLKTVSIRQAVCYFKLQGPQELYQLGKFPNWSSIGEGKNQVFYGLPEFGGEGIKVAQHTTVGKEDDPHLIQLVPDSTRTIEEFVETQFASPIEKRIGSETCFYTNTLTEDFIIDLLDPRIAIGSVCSGHGFKFAPLTGKILSELVLFGKTTVPEFEENRSIFSHY